MAEKMKSAIEQITLDGATFEGTGATITPTYINFFFGRNGAGKSTLAEAITKDDGIQWGKSVSRSEYDVLVYNQDFIDSNFSNYDNLPGVITIHKHNIEVQEKLDAAKKKKAEIESEGKELARTQGEKKEYRKEVVDKFQQFLWKQSLNFREDFKEALKGALRIQLFAETVCGVKKPVEHDYDELKRLYDIAFSSDSRIYPAFARIDSAPKYGTLPGAELLDKPIISSSDTPFSHFIKAMNATDWVRQGHIHYGQKADGKCPYCQQALPSGFEEDIAACFDAQYQQDLADLHEFEMTYARETDTIIDKLTSNLKDVLPSLDMTEYKDKLALLQSLFKVNRQRIADKIKEPTSIVALEDTDSILIDLGNIIDAINGSITMNNNVVNDRRTKQAQCKREIWEVIAYTHRELIADHYKELADIDKEVEGLDKAIGKSRADYRTTMNEITDLNKQGVNTEEAINNINAILRDSGFQGFELKPKKGVNDTYEVIRPHTNKPAVRLSEGERNFIAFLYFYQLVRGNGKVGGTASFGSIDTTPEGADTRDKIVVIDDPVSSMDSNALFIVSSIVREMISVCYNNTEYRNPEVEGDYIKQIFVLTHNAYFHNEITHREVSHYRSTSFYIIRKVDNVSSIVPCVRDSSVPGEKENYNPVQNSYAALWRELQTLYQEDNASIAIKNVSRRILDQYFLQLCGFSGSDVRKTVLEKNKDRFIERVEGGKPNYQKYHVASALLNYISSPSGIGDEMFIDDDCVDSECHRNVFKTIFEAMGQDQHYNMMMEG